MSGHAPAAKGGTARARRRGGGGHEGGEEGNERWLVTYADMLTLLLVLFIVLFSISVVNTSKYIALKTSLATAFGSGEKSLLDGGTSLNGQQEIVILAATTQQVEAIKFAQIDGTISLVLRSAKDCQAADHTASPCPIIVTTGVTLRRMIDDFGVLPPQIVEVIQPTPYPQPKK